MDEEFHVLVSTMLLDGHLQHQRKIHNCCLDINGKRSNYVILPCGDVIQDTLF